ncbi:MAG: hypothetical protein SNJ57_08130 [Cyanobacteriota bacterium]
MLWVSLPLLLAAYTSFSWFLYQNTEHWVAWVLATVFAIVQALLLTAWSRGLRRFFRNWLQSSLGYFSLVLLGAMSIAVILVWYHVFEYILVVVAAEILARLDLQQAKLGRWQSLGVLTVISVLGLAIGWTAETTLHAPANRLLQIWPFGG